MSWTKLNQILKYLFNIYIKTVQTISQASLVLTLILHLHHRHRVPSRHRKLWIDDKFRLALL